MTQSKYYGKTNLFTINPSIYLLISNFTNRKNQWYNKFCSNNQKRYIHKDNEKQDIYFDKKFKFKIKEKRKQKIIVQIFLLLNFGKNKSLELNFASSMTVLLLTRSIYQFKLSIKIKIKRVIKFKRN